MTRRISSVQGLAFDGSSIRGFKSIENSDMMLVSDPTTAFIDPITEHPTLTLIGNVYDPMTRDAFDRDPRNVLRNAEAYMKSTGIADMAFMGPEAEFFIFDRVKYETGRNFSQYAVDSVEAPWNSGEWGGGHTSNYKGGYFPVAPIDTLQDVRSEMVRTMIRAGLPIEKHHHEVATAGQTEINLRGGPMINMADNIQLYKYVAKNVAAQFGKTATFMPKPMFEDNGSGMHTHQSLWKDGKPLFAGDQYAGLSQMALWYVGGILKHIDSLLAICAPTTNSYRRLVPGYEAPVVVAYSARNRSAACRIPVGSDSPKAKRIEFRCPDPSANPYLAFAAMLMAGLDGIKNQIDPGLPVRDRPVRGRDHKEGHHGQGIPGRGVGCPGSRSRLPDRRWRLQRRADRELHRHPAHRRRGRRAPAPPSPRVCHVLQRLSDAPIR